MGLIRNIRKGFMFLRSDVEVPAQDLALADQYLSGPERDLFLQMDDGDQVHSLRVARLCLESLEQFPHLDRGLIMRAALLHDVGKVGADLGLGFRTFWVLGHRVLPWVLDWIAAGGGEARPGGLRHKMYRQLRHAPIGAKMLREMGAEEELCRLVAATGGPRRQRPESLELEILWEADGDRTVTREDRA